jgi:all-trans-retinol 13,14-reductase
MLKAFLLLALFTVAAAFSGPRTMIRQHPGSTGMTARTQQRARAVDEVLYSPDRVEDEYDTIVIGSGIGGLTTASLLAQAQGQKVLVLEQHHKCGGCCHSFSAKGFKFGTGIHYVGEVDDEDLPVKKLVDAVAREGDPIQWDPLPTNYDTVLIGSGPNMRRYAVGMEWQSSLRDWFPDEREAIDKFFEMCRDAVKRGERAMAFKVLPRSLVHLLSVTGLHRFFDKGFHKYAQKTVSQVLDELTDNQELRAALSYLWLDYGTRKWTPIHT